MLLWDVKDRAKITPRFLVQAKGRMKLLELLRRGKYGQSSLEAGDGHARCEVPTRYIRVTSTRKLDKFIWNLG